jgi:hypothetical protein
MRRRLKLLFCFSAICVIAAGTFTVTAPTASASSGGCTEATTPGNGIWANACVSRSGNRIIADAYVGNYRGAWCEVHFELQERIASSGKILNIYPKKQSWCPSSYMRVEGPVRHINGFTQQVYFVTVVNAGGHIKVSPPLRVR